MDVIQADGQRVQETIRDCEYDIGVVGEWGHA